jgi:hypothetical protein
MTAIADERDYVLVINLEAVRMAVFVILLWREPCLRKTRGQRNFRCGMKLRNKHRKSFVDFLL